jgi:hypothetical protein
VSNINTPAGTELPSTRTLIKSTIVAGLAAFVILITVVLPAEYGVDYTGIGSAMGLTKMGEIKTSLAAEAAKDRTATIAEELPEKVSVEQSTVSQQDETNSAGVSALPPALTDSRKDEITITLRPDEGKEVKLVMGKGHQVEYSWRSDGGKVNFDSHADSKPLSIKYHGYGKGSELRSNGILEAAFDGNHGWFWRNRTSEIVNITLQLKGTYSEILEM